MTSVDEQLMKLAARFVARAGEERTALATAHDRGDRGELCDRAHRLAGTAPMFGYSAIGEAALALEEAAEDLDNDTAEAWQKLDRLLGELC